MVEVVAIFGPTAAGKTAVAEALAGLLETEVVSADAMQVYRGLSVLTNQSLHPTCLVGIRDVDEEMSAGEYARLAHAEVDRIVSARGVAVVAGGTGLYLRAAIADLQFPSPPSAGARAAWETLYNADPAQAHARLTMLDPAAGGRIHANDRRRVVRALELADVGESLRPARDRLWADETRRPTLVYGLDVPRKELERRIAVRVAAMFEQEVEREVDAALRHGVSTTAEQALGLREIAELPAAEARPRIEARTRKYASYQRKWMSRIPGISMLDGTRPPHELAREIAARVE